jgi:hypothetical protein
LCIPAILCLALGAALAADPRSEALRQRVLSASFLDDKRVAALELARLGSQDAKAALRALLDGEDGWDQAAAFEALLSMKDPGIDIILVQRYADDSYLRSLVGRAFLNEAARLMPTIEKAYAASDDDAQAALIEAVGQADQDSAAVFLRSIVLDGASPHREKAYQAYCLRRRAGDLALARSLAAPAGSGPSLRALALARLAGIGSSADLQLFRAAFQEQDGGGGRIAALEGIARFAPAEERSQVFLESLDSPDVGLAEAALVQFSELRSPALMRRAGRLAAGDDPFLSLRAGIYLSGYGTMEAAVLAASAFRPAYRENPSMPGFFDWFANLVTVGLVGILEKSQNIHNRREFEAQRQRLADRLSAIAGVNLGPNYMAWEDHFVMQGYSLNGANLAQALLSSDSRLRARARAAAARLLGFTGEEAIAVQDQAYRGADEFRRGLVLAERLRTKGLPRFWDGPE